MTYGTWRGVKECAISRFPAVPKATPERLSNPAITHKRAVFASPGSRVTKPPTEILTLQVKCRQYGESVGRARFVTRQLVRDVRVLNRLSEGMCKTFCHRLRLKCDGTRAGTIFRLSAKRTSLLNRRGLQFSRLLAAEVCSSAVVMLDTPCSEVV